MDKKYHEMVVFCVVAGAIYRNLPTYILIVRLAVPPGQKDKISAAIQTTSSFISR